MTKTTHTILFFSLFIGFFACKTPKVATDSPPKTPSTTSKPSGDDGIIEVVFLQMNDVYEIASSSTDNVGGLARVASIRKELLAKNPNTITVIAGDFISPSVTGTLRYEGKRIRGKHMVEGLNAVGVDWAVFGNHEFDYDDQADLQARLDESNFTWLGANARLKTQTWTMQFYKNRNGGQEICPDNKIATLKDADGTTIELGVFGVLINTGRKPYVEYSDWADASKKNFDILKPKTDVVVALTHLAIEDDLKLAAMLPELPLVMGGHEHENSMHKVGKTTVAKADANAKTVYVHTLRYDKNKKMATVRSELRKVDASLPDEPATAAVVAKWEKIKTEALTSSGFDPAKTVTNKIKSLDCRETLVRNKPAEVGDLLTKAMIAASKNKPECAVVNSGSVRVDDVLYSPFTELDIVRMLPFGGAIVEAELRGSLLRKMLDAGYNNKGNGGYLQYQNIRRDETKGQWVVGTAALGDTKTYRVVLPDFLLTGNEQNMAFLKAAPNADGKGTSNPEVLSISKPMATDKADLRNDIRLAFIDYLKKL